MSGDDDLPLEPKRSPLGKEYCILAEELFKGLTSILCGSSYSFKLTPLLFRDLLARLSGLMSVIMWRSGNNFIIVFFNVNVNDLLIRQFNFHSFNQLYK